LRILKFITNDFILFLVNITILTLIYYNYIYQSFDIIKEILLITISYYLISLVTSASITISLYIIVKPVFYGIIKYTILKKLEIISYIFSEYYDDINNLKDFELKLKEIYC